MGSSNKLRQGLAPLPLINDASGQPCTSNEAVLNRWISFFSEMEGGTRVSLTEQRSIWRSNLAQLSQACFEIDITDIPSLTELGESMSSSESRQGIRNGWYPIGAFTISARTSCETVLLPPLEDLPSRPRASRPQGRLPGTHLEGKAQQGHVRRFAPS